jgi:DNA-directed RNA polymerase specialized sigma24 family protein
LLSANPPVHRELQLEKDDLVWIPLYSKISKWIFNLFVRKGFDRVYVEAEIVPELAQEAAIQILKAHFTYDTDFDPWAYTIINDTCLKYMRAAFKKSVVPSKALVDLDKLIEEKLADPRQRPDDPFTENRAAVLDAINRLPLSGARSSSKSISTNYPLIRSLKEPTDLLPLYIRCIFTPLKSAQDSFELRNILNERK